MLPADNSRGLLCVSGGKGGRFSHPPMTIYGLQNSVGPKQTPRGVRSGVPSYPSMDPS